MDQKRLFLAIAISLAILLGFQMLVVPHLPKPPVPPVAQTDTTPLRPAATPAEAAAAAAETVPKDVPRLTIAGRRVQGSVSLLGARIDDIVLSDYKETLDPGSPDVRLLEPRSDDKPYYVQYGWTAASGEPVKLPDNNTVWSRSMGTANRSMPRNSGTTRSPRPRPKP